MSILTTLNYTVCAATGALNVGGNFLDKINPINIFKTEAMMAMDGMQKFIYTSYASFTDTLMNTIVSTLKMGTGEGAVVMEVWNMLLPLAYALVIIFFLVELLQKATSLGHGQSLDEKFMISALLKLILAEGLLAFGPKLIEALLSLTNTMLNLANNVNITQALASAVSSSQSDTVNNALYEGIKNLGFMDCLALMPNALVNLVCNTVATFALQLQAISKKIELILYGCFSGVAMASCFGEASRATAIRYLKKFLACVLHAMCIVLIIKITDGLNSYSLIDAISNGKIDLASLPPTEVLKTVLYKFAAIGSISVAKSIINEALS